MLSEFHLKQDERFNIKRWFQDDYFDLFIWQNNPGQIISFQLCYDRSGNERVISWDHKRGFGHHRVDDGEASPHKNMTPIFVKDEAFSSYDEVLSKFTQSSKQISQDICSFIVQKLEEYSP
ncbi:MAG: hypothetical protein DRQ49_00070 [Gammaproteobacteria bacterium]|nr:MAG: hypothetical protein DRQ49_00070 [Gammaproteobacteria bacterium]RKZ77128.1 MAG: hypothetical protein DRQ57_01370 [Gammaproteobacteria bacterium]